MLTDDALREARDDALWHEFDRQTGIRALTLSALRGKLDHARWALVERQCEDQAAIMIASCIADLEHAQD